MFTVPLAIFKREKEIARRLEFDGLYIVEQPEDDDIKAYWDKLVKKKVRQKYSESYDFDAISNLLGMEKTSLAQEEAPPGFINNLHCTYCTQCRLALPGIHVPISQS